MLHSVACDATTRCSNSVSVMLFSIVLVSFTACVPYCDGCICMLASSISAVYIVDVVVARVYVHSILVIVTRECMEDS